MLVGEDGGTEGGRTHSKSRPSRPYWSTMAVRALMKTVRFSAEPMFEDMKRDPVQPPTEMRAFTFCDDCVSAQVLIQSPARQEAHLCLGCRHESRDALRVRLAQVQTAVRGRLATCCVSRYVGCPVSWKRVHTYAKAYFTSVNFSQETSSTVNPSSTWYPAK